MERPKELPQWTLSYNISCDTYVGKGQEVFKTKESAEPRLNELKSDDRYVVTSRPFHYTDIPRMGAYCQGERHPFTKWYNHRKSIFDI